MPSPTSSTTSCGNFAAFAAVRNRNDLMTGESSSAAPCVTVTVFTVPSAPFNVISASRPLRALLPSTPTLKVFSSHGSFRTSAPST